MVCFSSKFNRNDYYTAKFNFILVTQRQCSVFVFNLLKYVLILYNFVHKINISIYLSIYPYKFQKKVGNVLELLVIYLWTSNHKYSSPF